MANEQQLDKPIEDKELSKEDVISLLGEEDEDEEKEEKKEDEKEDKEKSIGDEEKEEEEIKLKDDEELSEEEEEKLVTPFKKKELLKKYPNLLKEFPYIEKSYYRDQQFTEVFATPQDAKDAAERLQTLDEFERDLSEGNIESVLNLVKEHDKKAFNKVVDNYVRVLEKIDRDAHIHVVSGIVKNLIISLVNEAKSTDNEELRKVALAINKFAFGSDQFVPHAPLGKGKEEEDAINEEKNDWIRERFETTRDDLDTRVENILKSTINENIDPKELMTDYVKKTAVRDALEGVISALDKDVNFRRQLDSLWKRAFDSKFSRDSINAIRSAYLSKAKTVLPSIIKNARNEALRGLGKRVREEESDDKRGHLPVNRTSTSSTNRGQKKVEIPKGMTTLDFLNQD